MQCVAHVATFRSNVSASAFRTTVQVDEGILRRTVSLLQDGLRAFSQSEPQKAGIGDRIVAGPWDIRFFRRRKSSCFMNATECILN